MTPLSVNFLLLLLFASLPLRVGQVNPLPMWLERAELIGEAHDSFGHSVTTNDGILAVGAPHVQAGYVSVFERSDVSRYDDEWILQTKLIASDSDENKLFGWSVALSDGTLAVGAPTEGQGGSDASAVYIYGTEAGGMWTEQQQLLPSDINASRRFGWSLVIQGSWLVVGALGVSSNAGATYVYSFIAGSWTEHAKLTASDGSPGLGYALAMSEDEMLVVGAMSDDDLGNDTGAAYAFELLGGLWTQQAKLTPSDGQSSSSFGCSVVIKGGTVFVGSNGAVYRYDMQDDATWAENSKLVPSDSAPGFGHSLGLDYGELVVAATGAFYSFWVLGMRFIEETKIGANVQAVLTVNYNDGIVIVGASGDNDMRGSVYDFGMEVFYHSYPRPRPPSSNPTVLPTARSSVGRSQAPSVQPSIIPSDAPSTGQFTTFPSLIPTSNPTRLPTAMPSFGPSQAPLVQPSIIPSGAPSNGPMFSVVQITVDETAQPSVGPSPDSPKRSVFCLVFVFLCQD